MRELRYALHELMALVLGCAWPCFTRLMHLAIAHSMTQLHLKSFGMFVTPA